MASSKAPRLIQLEAEPDLLCDQTELGPDRVRHFFAYDHESRSERMPHANRARHQLEALGKLLIEEAHPTTGQARNPQIGEERDQHAERRLERVARPREEGRDAAATQQHARHQKAVQRHRAARAVEDHLEPAQTR